MPVLGPSLRSPVDLDDDSMYYSRLRRQQSSPAVSAARSNYDYRSSHADTYGCRSLGSSAVRPLHVSSPLERADRALSRFYGTSAATLRRPDYATSAAKPPLPPPSAPGRYVTCRSYANGSALDSDSYAAHRLLHGRSSSVDRRYANRHDAPVDERRLLPGQVERMASRLDALVGPRSSSRPPTRYDGAHSLLNGTSPSDSSSSADDVEERDHLAALRPCHAGLYRSRLGAASMPDVPSLRESAARAESAPTRSELSRGESSRGSSSSVDSGASSTGSTSAASSSARRRRVEFADSPSSSRQTRSVSSNESARCNSRAGLLGLQNIGNTCFMNSVLQCLSHTKPLREYCLCSWSSADMNNNTSRMKGALMKSFCDLLSHLWSESRTIYATPDHFKSQVQKFAPRFTGYSQQDSQEFLRYLLQGLHEDVNLVRGRLPPVAPIDDSLADDEKAAVAWQRYLRLDNSRIGDIFVGQLKSELRCTECRHVSTTFDPFWDLSLPLPTERRGDGVSLDHCLDAFTREEVLDGDEKPVRPARRRVAHLSARFQKCEKCKAHRRCTKKFSIFKFPKILVLHLKRFSGERYKSRLSTLVTFPLSGLSLGKYAASGECAAAAAASTARAGTAPAPRYNLYAVSNHSGTPLMGHYTAFTLHAARAKWHLYDDSRISAVAESSVVTSEAYVLFYEVAAAGQPKL